MLFVNGFVVVIMAEQPVVVFCSFLDRKLDAIRAAGEGGTGAHVNDPTQFEQVDET